MVQKHDIVDYYDDRRISTALVLDADNKKIRLLTQQGKESKVSPNRILIHAKDSNFPVQASRDEQIGELRTINNLRDRIKEDIDLKELWEVISSEASETTVKELTELLFGEEIDSHKPAGLLRAIQEDRIFFKVKLNSIEVPPQEKVQQALAQKEREKERLTYISDAKDFLENLVSKKDSIGTDPPAGLIKMLEDAALLGKDWETHKTVKSIFTLAGISKALTPFSILVRMGHWNEDENLRIIAEQVPIEFSSQCIEEAGQVATRPVPDHLEDLTDRTTYSIDSITTRDVDDALSLVETGDGPELGVHITDVTHFLDHGSFLDKEIRYRGTSIYLPDLTIPMAPEALSEKAASLTAGMAQPAISVLVKFNNDLELVDYRIANTICKVTQRLTYEEADERILSGSSIEKRMFEIAAAVRDQRVKSGAVIFKDPEIYIYLDENKDIQVVRRNRESPSQILVSESMILANHLFAKFLSDHKAAAIFRGQPDPVEKIELGEKFDPVESFQAKRLLGRGEVGTSPARHSTLGLDCYTTATSPLRRYPDVIVQRQLKSVLKTGAPLMDSSELEDILSVISGPLDRAGLMERERKRYFLLKYLREKRHDEIMATVLQRFPKFYLVYLEDYSLNIPMRPSDDVHLKPGDRVIIRLDKVIPREDKINCILVRPV